MDNKELAEQIKERFTPFAFACECDGAHADCKHIKNSPAGWAQYDTVMRIAKFIEEQGK